jgi:hypothetical protein
MYFACLRVGITEGMVVQFHQDSFSLELYLSSYSIVKILLIIKSYYIKSSMNIGVQRRLTKAG